MLTLPTERIPAKTTNPRFLILYGKPESLGTTPKCVRKNISLISGTFFTTFIRYMYITIKIGKKQSEAK